MKAKNGQTVTIEYRGTLDSGEEFDASKNHGRPLTFTLGEGQVIPGFESAVEGMEVGEKKSFRLEASEAYGDRRDDLIIDFPKSQVEDSEVSLEVGAQIGLQTPQGPIPATIADVGEESVKIDANHPLAGQPLNFEIELVSAEDASEAAAESVPPAQ